MAGFFITSLKIPCPSQQVLFTHSMLRADSYQAGVLRKRQAGEQASAGQGLTHWAPACSKLGTWKNEEKLESPAASTPWDEDSSVISSSGSVAPSTGVIQNVGPRAWPGKVWAIPVSKSCQQIPRQEEKEEETLVRSPLARTHA
jgi:hypothetical protein